MFFNAIVRQPINDSPLTRHDGPHPHTHYLQRSRQHLNIHVAPTRPWESTDPLNFCSLRVYFSNHEKFRFPEWVSFTWLLLQFADKHQCRQTCKTAVQQRGGRGAAGRGQGQNTTVWESFSPATVRCLLYTHMPNEKKSSNKSKQPNIEN